MAHQKQRSLSKPVQQTLNTIEMIEASQAAATASLNSMQGISAARGGRTQLATKTPDALKSPFKKNELTQMQQPAASSQSAMAAQMMFVRGRSDKANA